MPSEVVLLMRDEEAAHFGALLRRFNPVLTLTPAPDRAALEAACRAPRADGGTRRLIAFCTSVIVPGWVLDAVDGPAYNFHPGPPEYPGNCGVNFAVYDGADTYGVTAHVMEKSIDSGAIVAVERFAVPKTMDALALEAETYRVLAALFARLAEPLACSDAPLPATNEPWSGPVHTRAEYEAMIAVDDTLDDAEILRRRRATT